MYKTSRLKNGLTILKVPIRGSKSVLVDVFVKVGSRSEAAKLNGASHFLEHLFFKGSQKYPTPLELSHALDAIGASYNASTSKEFTQYYIKAAKKHLRFIFETLTDVIQNPIFAEAEINRERGVIIEEINMYEDTPIRHIDDLLEGQMWPGQPLGWNIAGTRQTIRQMIRKDILGYRQTYYQPQNIIVAVAGSFSETLFDQLVKKRWQRLSARPSPKWQRVRNSQKAPRFKIARKSTEQYHLALGFEGLDYNHKDNISLTVLAALLGGGMSSRLFTEVREKQGLAYYVSAASNSYQDTGNFEIKAGVKLAAVAKALQLILAEVARTKREDAPEVELNKTKEFIKGTLTLAFEESEDLLAWYLEQLAFCREVIEPEEFFRKIDAVQAADLRRVARYVFSEPRLNLIILGPKRRALNFARLRI